MIRSIPVGSVVKCMKSYSNHFEVLLSIIDSEYSLWFDSREGRVLQLMNFADEARVEACGYKLIK